MKKTRRFALILVVGMLIAACSDRVPPGVLRHDQMVDFLTEAYLIEGFYAIETGYHYESLTPDVVSSYQELLQRHQITQQQFERSIEYYMHHPEKYETIHQEVVERLDAKNPNPDESDGKSIKDHPFKGLKRI